jgi:hypothetical protein
MSPYPAPVELTCLKSYPETSWLFISIAKTKGVLTGRTFRTEHVTLNRLWVSTTKRDIPARPGASQKKTNPMIQLGLLLQQIGRSSKLGDYGSGRDCLQKGAYAEWVTSHSNSADPSMKKTSTLRSCLGLPG